MQLVVPEPRRLTPVDVTDDNPDTQKSVPDSGLKSATLVQSLTPTYPHPGMPWALPFFPGIPAYPYFRYPGLNAHPLSMFADHIPWRYVPVEHKDTLYGRVPLYAGLYEHPDKRLDSPPERSKDDGHVSDDSKFEHAGKTAIDPEFIKRPSPVFLTTEVGSEEKKKKKETEQSKYVCTACNKSYSTFSGLSKHKQFHCNPDGKKEFSCKYCDKTYVSLGALKMHIRTHTLPCKCKICGKAFSRPWLLQGHVRTHTGEKPFTCVHCLRAFADRSNLRAHLQTHSDVKKYSCKTCSKTFSRMSLLLKHEDTCARTDVI